MTYILFIGAVLSLFLIVIIYFIRKKIQVFLKFCTNIFEISDYFISYKLFNKKERIALKKKIKKKIYPKIAIIIQGPLINKNKFTVETIKFYSNLYPETLIIFSSWKNDIDQLKKEKFRKNIKLIENTIPSYQGYKNINLQSVSSKNAIMYAKKQRCKYVLKTRSDMRICDLNFIEYLLEAIKFYKTNTNSSLHQKERIITTSFTLRYRLYGISDMIMFGNIHDIYKYFNILTTSNTENKFLKFLLKLKFKDKNYFLQNEFCPEIYFFSEFFKKLKIKLNWSVDDYIKKISNNFIIIDNKSLSVYWKKSNKVDNHFSHKPIPDNTSLEFNFETWLKIFYKSKKIRDL